MRVTTTILSGLLAIACCAYGARAADGLALDPAATLPLSITGLTLDETAPAPPSATAPDTRRWGDANTFTFNVSAGYADDFDGIGIAPGGVGVSWFPIRMFSIDLSAEGAYITQPGEDSGGGGLSLMLRWHFLDFDSWTLYGDLGIGFLVLTEPVPQDAASFVFTPRAGLGVSFAVNEKTRVLTGARWLHISNAQTASENPGVNALQGYVGLSIAF